MTLLEERTRRLAKRENRRNESVDSTQSSAGGYALKKLMPKLIKPAVFIAGFCMILNFASYQATKKHHEDGRSRQEIESFYSRLSDKFYPTNAMITVCRPGINLYYYLHDMEE